MAIQIDEIVVPEEGVTYTSNRRYTSRRGSSRAVSHHTPSTSVMSKFDINSLNSDTGKLGLFGGSFVVLLLAVWVFLYSFAPGFVRYSKKCSKRGFNVNAADPLKTLGWALLIALLIAIIFGLIYSMLPMSHQW